MSCKTPRRSNYESVISPVYPADATVEVSALGLPELEFEIEVIALAAGRDHRVSSVSLV